MAYTPESFAVAVLHRLGKPTTPANVQALVGWQRAEGGHWHNNARFNPLNTTQPAPGAGNTGTQGNIKVYRSAQQGIDATVQTLRNGRYGGILAAFSKGNNPNAVAQAIGTSPWGTSAALISKVIGGTPPPSKVPADAGTTTTTSTTSLTPQADQGRRAALASFVLSSGKPDPVALAQQVAGFNAQTQTTKNTVTTPGTPASGSAPSGKRSPLYEMFWQGSGGIDVKNGQKVPQGFVSGHQDHVHLAAGRSTVVELGRVAQQQFGLHVGENPHFGGVHPVHVQGSYHYKNQAIDVSGDPGKMRAFAHYVANLYGIK